jgi:cytochrome c oxidase cbb3-type subunit 3
VSANLTEFTSGFWDVYISVITIVSIVACAVLLKAQTKAKKPGEAVGTTGHVWDEDLGEYNNPLPSWWKWLFYLTIVFSIAYLILYPGLGSWKGTLGWSQVSQLDDEMARAEKALAPLYGKFARIEIEALAKDREALAIGQKLFLNNCAQCHASDGGGSRGFPNLTDRDWQWGGDAARIQASILDGRTGLMPAWGEALGEQGVKDVTHYVLSLSGSTNDSLRRHRGEAIYKGTCVGCHGADGKGNAALGAPNLTDRIWLHGAGEAAIMDVVMKGRTGQMPAHRNLLGEHRVRLLSAYVYSLSNRGD